MHVKSRLAVAVAVSLATIIVCFFGIRAELSQASVRASASPHVKTLKASAGPPLARDGQR
jgi:hypothetical protein